ncbi:MAG TPA: F0F1 ATP synthase subunit A [Candidatus Acidoferrales bacterium]
MENHVSWITQLVNHIFGRFALALLSALHVKSSNPETPIPEHVVMAMLVLITGTLFALFLRSRLSVDRPGASQQVAEFLITNPLSFGIRDILRDNAGHHSEKHIPVVGSVSIFILLSNLFGVVPILSSPTASATVPFACAIITFLYFNLQGARHHGPVGYVKHFAGPVWWLSPLMLPVEILSTTARLLSLTVRLWANIFASDMIYGLFLGLFAGPAIWGWAKNPVLGVILGVLPALIPLAFIALHIFVSVIQTYVFTILPAVYIGMATADGH